MKLTELLSPAGGMESLRAAVENGADAVYMGGRLYNARRNAVNFGDDEMKKAIEYAHVRGVNIYITMNTLITDAEMPQAVDAAAFVYEAGADALIVQDLGFASALRELAPDLPLHISTQGTVYSLEGISALEPLGFSRAILARELSLEEVGTIAKNSPVPVEVFAHGALCVCYSGQCLMSSFIGSRSGNRGSCAQPCRLPYELGGKKGYLMSPKDLCTLEFLPELVSTGVAALKIEGRMKSPEYVAVVTGIYRKYLDLIASGGEYHVDAQDMQALQQIFNRGGFTQGYLKGRRGRELICRERPKNWGVKVGSVVTYNKPSGILEAELIGRLSSGDGVEVARGELPGNIVTYLTVNGGKAGSAGPGRAALGYIKGDVRPGDELYKTSDREQNERARESFTGKPRRRVRIRGAFSAAAGELLRLEVWDADGHRASAESAAPAELAQTKPLTEETALNQLARTGDTPFELEECAVLLDGRAAVRLSELNALRREALYKLEELRANRYPGRTVPVILLKPREAGDKYVEPRLSVYLYCWREELAETLGEADRVYVPFADFVSGKTAFKHRPKELIAWLPAVSNGSLDALVKKHFKGLKEHGLDGVLVGNAAHIELLRGCGLPLYGDSSLNAFNGQTLQAYAALGLKGVTLSQELTLEQIAALPETGVQKEGAVYGRQGLMLSAHCPVGAEVAGVSGGKPCGLCAKGGAYELVDRTGARFPVLCDALDCRSTVLNADVLFVPGLARRLAAAGFSMLRLYVYDEPSQEVERLLLLYRLSLRGEEADAGGALGRGYTKGHYFREV
jgi:U32 family peptidase